MFDQVDQVAPERAAYWDFIQTSQLHYQQCHACGNAWLPPAAECPRCLAADWRWVEASGGGGIVSWVVYYRAAQPEFEAHVPYNVVVVELEEGPRLISTVPEDPTGQAMEVDRPVRLAFEKVNGVHLPVFRYTDTKEPI